MTCVGYAEGTTRFASYLLKFVVHHCFRLISLLTLAMLCACLIDVFQ